ncbi:hypothetical protein B2J88_03025 [Rhodococcus sp. SRB_17]|nr:hypothetical protein [Rhodococcus sp. SRB_17]
MCLILRDGDLTRLTASIRSRSVRAGIAQRARIIVLASEGESNTRIAELVGVTRQTVITSWGSATALFADAWREYGVQPWRSETFKQYNSHRSEVSAPSLLNVNHPGLHGNPG